MGGSYGSLAIQKSWLSFTEWVKAQADINGANLTYPESSVPDSGSQPTTVFVTC